MGLNDSSLVIKSKLKEEDAEETGVDQVQKMYEAFRPKIVSKSKNYRYFFRGQYEVVADNEDLLTVHKQRKHKLQPYETHLKRFEYKLALNSALQSKNPEVILALIEELVARQGLHMALANRSEPELLILISFLTWKIADHRYSDVLVEVARILIDMYLGVMGMSSQVDKALFKDLK